MHIGKTQWRFRSWPGRMPGSGDVCSEQQQRAQTANVSEVKTGTCAHQSDKCSAAFSQTSHITYF